MVEAFFGKHGLENLRIENSLKFKIAPISILLLSLFIARVSAAQADREPCVPCIKGDGKQGCDTCLKALEAKDLSFLSGRQPPIGIWKADGDMVPKLCKRIRNGDSNALSIGFRLAVILDEKSSESVIGALSESILKNPTGFLGQLQNMMDFCKKENEMGPLKECYWSAFIDNDFEYGDRPEEELKAIRKRREAIQKIENPVFKESQTYFSELLGEKERRLTSGM